jgi:hypothetical protein
MPSRKQVAACWCGGRARRGPRTGRVRASDTSGNAPRSRRSAARVRRRRSSRGRRRPRAPRRVRREERRDGFGLRAWRPCYGCDAALRAVPPRRFATRFSGSDGQARSRGPQ